MSELGATFSHRHLKYLNLDIDTSLMKFKKIGLKWMRVCCYWSDIEEEESKFDFSEIDKIIRFCEKNNIKVIMTIGMKAPRWPEYYLPNWVHWKFRLFDVVRVNNEVLL